MVENACAAAATRPTFAGVTRSLLLAAEGFPDLLFALLLARLIPVAIRRDVAAGFEIIARCAAAVSAAAAAAGGGSACVSTPERSETPAPPTRERRSGLEVKYLQEKDGP